MTSRSRPRGNMKDEERDMWSQLLVDIKRAKAINTLCAEKSNHIKTTENEMAPAPSIKEIDDLNDLYRDNNRLSEEEFKLLCEEPNDIMKNLSILKALRAASEDSSIRANQLIKSRTQKRAGRVDNDGSLESPGPSPSVVIPSSRNKGSSVVRSGSVPLAKELRDPIIKAEEIVDGYPNLITERLNKLVKGAEVAYKQARAKEDGSQWIQCTIIEISEVKGKKQYQVQDPEPDENGAPGQIYLTSAAQLIPIPTPETPLSPYAVGKHVLARYPETTTFYDAEVKGGRKDICKLRFEDDQNKEMEVARRFVLDVGPRN